MRHAVTWVVMANARAVKVLENRGPGDGLRPLDRLTLLADPAPRPRVFRGDDIFGSRPPGRDPLAMERKTDARFARTIVQRLTDCFLAKDFDYIVLVAGPHMLGLLRVELAGDLRPVLAGEIPNDLSNQPPHALEMQVGEIIPV